ncbi:MAG: hypothetical protein IKA76_00550 [Clostridia bacterium]|nr:hypothetical protein [Clostridia bacterium]
MKKIGIIICCLLLTFLLISCNQEVPSPSQPDAPESEAVTPEATEPEETFPETSEFGDTEPNILESEDPESEVTEPEVSEPEVSEPEVTEPEVTEPEVTEPEVSESEVTEPEVSEPEVTEPELSETEMTEPEVTEPEVTEPEVSEPEVTEPEVSEPVDTEAEDTESDPPAVFDDIVATRTYSLLGDTHNDIISVTFNKDGKMLMISSHDLELTYKNCYGDIAIFLYDDNGVMTAVKHGIKQSAVNSYDEQGRPLSAGDTVTFRYANDEITISLDGNHVYTFDSLGRCIKYVTNAGTDQEITYLLSLKEQMGLWSSTESDRCSVIQYKDHALIIVSDSIFLTQANGYEYNDRGLPVRVIVVDDTAILEMEYSASDRPDKITVYKPGSNPLEKLEERHFTYDEDGRLLTFTEFDAEGNFSHAETNVYNELGQLIHIETTDDGQTKGFADATYDEYGNRNYLAWSYQNADGTIRMISEEGYVFYANGKMAEFRETFYEDGTGVKLSLAIVEFREDGSRAKLYGYKYAPNGVPTAYVERHFTETDSISKELWITYNEDGTEAERRECYYDEEGNPIQPQ